MLFDTHAHPYLSEKLNEKEILESIKNSKIPNYIVSVGTKQETSQKCIEITKKYDFAFASIWIHPCETLELIWQEKQVQKQLEIMLQNNSKIVAIGECWLDYYRLPPRIESKLKIEEIKQIQANFFKMQIQIAKKYNLPLIIHNRESKEDILTILKEEDFKNFVFHCYTEDIKYAQKLLDFSPNCKLSFSGIITFKNAILVQETAKYIPLKNIMIETDSPYLSPAPERWQENSPQKVKFVLEKIQELRKEENDLIENTIYQNSLDFFGIL
jgi:TatD DNase family protein